MVRKKEAAPVADGALKSKTKPRKIAFYMSEFVLAKVAEGWLGMLPGWMNPVTAEKIRAEDKLINGSGSDYLLEPTKAAEREGRLLTGWSKPRAKENTLTWQQWDEFVTRWCGDGLVYRSSERKELFDGNVMFKEVRTLTDLKLLEPVGRIARQFETDDEAATKAKPTRKKKKAPADDE